MKTILPAAFLVGAVPGLMPAEKNVRPRDGAMKVFWQE